MKITIVKKKKYDLFVDHENIYFKYMKDNKCICKDYRINQ